jgi:hypothetical protein
VGVVQLLLLRDGDCSEEGFLGLRGPECGGSGIIPTPVIRPLRFIRFFMGNPLLRSVMKSRRLIAFPRFRTIIVAG